jgi:hypothetical protein
VAYEVKRLSHGRLGRLSLTDHMTSPNGTESIHPVPGFGELAATIARPALRAGYVRAATIAAAFTYFHDDALKGAS